MSGPCRFLWISAKEEDYDEGYSANQQDPYHLGGDPCVDPYEVGDWNAGGQEGYCEEEAYQEGLAYAQGGWGKGAYRGGTGNGMPHGMGKKQGGKKGGNYGGWKGQHKGEGQRIGEVPVPWTVPPLLGVGPLPQLVPLQRDVLVCRSQGCGVGQEHERHPKCGGGP